MHISLARCTQHPSGSYVPYLGVVKAFNVSEVRLHNSRVVRRRFLNLGDHSGLGKQPSVLHPQCGIAKGIIWCKQSLLSVVEHLEDDLNHPCCAWFAVRVHHYIPLPDVGLQLIPHPNVDVHCLFDQAQDGSLHPMQAKLFIHKIDQCRVGDGHFHLQYRVSSAMGRILSHVEWLFSWCWLRVSFHVGNSSIMFWWKCRFRQVDLRFC